MTSLYQHITSSLSEYLLMFLTFVIYSFTTILFISSFVRMIIASYFSYKTSYENAVIKAQIELLSQKMPSE